MKQQIESAASLSEFQNQYKQEQEDEIWQQIAFLLHNSAMVSPKTISEVIFSSPMPEFTKGVQFRDAFTIAIEDNELALDQLLMFPDSQSYEYGFRYKVTSQGWMVIGDNVLRQKFDLRHTSLHQLGTWVEYPRDDRWIQENPLSAIQEVLAQSHKQNPDTVSGLFSIVHLQIVKPKDSSNRVRVKIKYDWLQKGRCPGWDEVTHPLTSIKMTESDSRR